MGLVVVVAREQQRQVAAADGVPGWHVGVWLCAIAPASHHQRSVVVVVVVLALFFILFKLEATCCKQQLMNCRVCCCSLCCIHFSAVCVTQSSAFSTFLSPHCTDWRTMLLSHPQQLSTVSCRGSRCRAVVKPLCALKTAAKTTRKQAKPTGSRSKQNTSIATASRAAYLALTGFSAAAGTALTLAPQTFWELLGSRDIVDVTLSSSEVGVTPAPCHPGPPPPPPALQTHVPWCRQLQAHACRLAC